MKDSNLPNMGLLAFVFDTSYRWCFFGAIFRANFPRYFATFSFRECAQ